MDNNQLPALTSYQGAISPAPEIAPLSIGDVADQVARRSILQDYREKCAANTLRRQKADIATFEAFLAQLPEHERIQYGLSDLDISDLADDLTKWWFMSWGLLEVYKRWSLQQGYALRTISIRLTTLKTYCAMAAKAGYLEKERLPFIQSVRGYSQKEAANVDAKRPVKRRSTKKEQPTPLKPAHVEMLKEQPDTPAGRRDRLIICLLFDHALRCGEIAALNVHDLELDTALQVGTLHIPNVKTKDEPSTADLTPDTYAAALAYLADVMQRPGPGPLFTGKISRERMNERSIYHRVHLAGERIGLNLAISPHDGRHFFVDDAFNNENDLRTIQQAGRWKTSAMPLYYATRKQVINRGLKLSATKRKE